MRIRLLTRITIAVTGLLVLAILSSVASVATALYLDRRLDIVITQNLASVRAAEELEIALLEQRGYVMAFMLDDGDESWLQQLDHKRSSFSHWLQRARISAHTPHEQRILDDLEREYGLYQRTRDAVVEQYRAGNQTQARHLVLGDVTDAYERAYQLCEAFVDTNNEFVDAEGMAARRGVERLIVALVVMMAVTTAMAGMLWWTFFGGVILPLRQMAAEAQLMAPPAGSSVREMASDELRQVGFYLRQLMTSISETRTSLADQQRRLASAERLAAVGKLAASVAHEIRNPLTSIKMWLFSLRRGLADAPETLAKLELVFEEITRLERIVYNFLEFSRPPQLRLSRQSLPQVLERTLAILRDRFAAENIELECRFDSVPEILADPEQLRQVFLNLIENALDAMPGGGRLSMEIKADESSEAPAVVVTVEDSGSGLSDAARDHLFEPFFSTKAQGTGLGLCIAAAIVSRHQGRLWLEGTSSQGSLFKLQLPTGFSHSVPQTS